ncbi:hypothetical protein TeGR_g5600, partial [Tetraparma gracilis]
PPPTLDCVFYLYLIRTVGSGLGLTLLLFNRTSPLGQSAVLQATSFVCLTAASHVGFRGTNEERFPPLMLAIFFQVDLFASFLYLKEDIFSVVFWLMLITQEGASIFKNS